jgi:hypothetical protein
MPIKRTSFSEQDQLPPGMAEAFLLAVNRYRRRVGVVVVDVGFRWVAGEMTDELAIRFHVREKLAILPLRQRFPREVEGFTVDVIQARPAQLCESAAVISARRTAMPLAGGHQCGGAGRVGTVGMLVRKTTKRYFISARHVLTGALGTAVTHPGNGADAATVGTISGTNNANDAVLVRIADGVEATPVIHGAIALTGTCTPFIGQHVTKSGAASGLSKGRIDGRGVFTAGGGLWVSSITPTDGCSVGSPGDSGAIWFSNRCAVGMLVAATVPSTGPGAHGYATDAESIFRDFSVTAYT